MKGHLSEAALVGLTILVLGLVACGAATATPEPSELSGGIVATFEVVDEEFRAG